MALFDIISHFVFFIFYFANKIHSLVLLLNLLRSRMRLKKEEFDKREE